MKLHRKYYRIKTFGILFINFSHCFLPGVLQIFILAGCVAVNLQEFSLETPAQILTYPAAPPMTDQRPRFREIFCGLINENSEAQKRQIECEDYLWYLHDEKQGARLKKSLPAHDGSLRVILVTGAFAECFPKMGKPYQDAAARLVKFGYRIDTIVVSGRSSSSHNAAMIAEAVNGLELKPTERLVLLGYSKGATDILHFLVDYPEIANKVTAVMSVAGVINGTPLADKFAETYANWFKNISFEKCEPGDGGVLESLKRSAQFSWMAAHPLPRNVRYFSIAAFAHREDVQPGLLLTYDLLRKIDPRNDGQVIFYDQIIPGSSLLGYVNLDHWAVAVPIREETASSAWAAASNHPHVRALLFEAMILFLVEQLSY
jgi:pimeloyl-ACP methyl ester carboxylesterase